MLLSYDQFILMLTPKTPNGLDRHCLILAIFIDRRQ